MKKALAGRHGISQAAPPHRRAGLRIDLPSFRPRMRSEISHSPLRRRWFRYAWRNVKMLPSVSVTLADDHTGRDLDRGVHDASAGAFAKPAGGDEIADYEVQTDVARRRARSTSR